MAIVFDLDETLISTSYRQYKVLCDIFLHDNLPTFHHYENERESQSISNYQWVCGSIKNLDKKKYLELYTHTIESSNYLKHDTLKVDLNLLNTLITQKKKKLILISLRNNQKNSLNQLKNLKLFSYFSEIYFVNH